MRHQKGFTLTEILVALALFAVVLSSVSNFLSSNRRVANELSAAAILDGNMRLAMSEVARSLRRTGYGVPGDDLAAWVPWVAGFTVNPLITPGTAGAPDTISIAHCTLSDITTLSANAAKGDLTISVASASGVNAANKRLLLLDIEEHVHVTAVSGTTLSIDTDIATAGQQGLNRDYPLGTPLCRVDVVTYDVDLVTNTLRVDHNDGTGPAVVADEVTDMQISVVGGGSGYTIALAGLSTTLDPVTGGHPSRNLITSVSPRN